MSYNRYMKHSLLSLVEDIHCALNQTRVFSIHAHRPYYDGQGVSRLTNVGERNEIAKDRIDKLVSDCGKMMDRVNACQDKMGYQIVNKHKDKLAVLHDLCNGSKHIKKERNPIGDFKPYLGEPRISVAFGAKPGSHAGIITAMDREKTSFWDIGDQGYACIVIEADVMKEGGKSYRELVSLTKESLGIWRTELERQGIDIPEYTEPDPFGEAAKFGQHGSLFVESYEDAHKKASILTCEKRFDDAASLYNYALTKCQNNIERAQCYGCLGLSYEDAGEIIMAQASYMTAIKYNPNMRGMHLNLGRIYAMFGDKDRAKILFQKELEISDGDHSSASKNLTMLQCS